MTQTANHPPRRWLQAALGILCLIAVGCAIAWPGRNAGSAGVFNATYILSLFGASLVAAVLVVRRSSRIAIVIILTSAQATVFYRAYPTEPLLPLGIAICAVIIATGVAAGAFIRAQITRNR